jgi:geranylgeranyl pyrophosphate synthase
VDRVSVLEGDPVQIIQVPTVPDQIERLLIACRGHLRERLADAPMGPLVVQYFARGKMLRARIVFLSAAAVNGEPAIAMPGAIAIELLHGASLAHDDIIDDASDRRGLPALHRQVGTDVALTLGDYLVLRAFSELLRASATHSPERVLSLVRNFSVSGQECCEGQILELRGPCDTEGAYLSMVQAKTGSLFAAAAVAGATLGGGTLEQVESLRSFGESLGRAYQIQDDVDEFVWERDPARSGAGAAGRQAPSLPLLLLTQYGSSGAVAEWRRLRATNRHHEIAALLHREAVWDRIVAAQDMTISTALKALNALGASDSVLALSTLADGCRCRYADGQGVPDMT